MAGLLNTLLAHPLTKGLSVDDPNTTMLRGEIIRSKPFLVAIYNEWYRLMLNALPQEEPILEIGSGAGFFKDVSSRVITSEVMDIPGINVRLFGFAARVNNKTSIRQ